MQRKSLRERTMKHTRLPCFNLFFFAIGGVLCSFLGTSPVFARLTDVDLSQLVGKSEVIAYGQVHSPTQRMAGQERVEFPVISLLKGKEAFKGGATVFSLCNPHSNSE